MVFVGRAHEVGVLRGLVEGVTRGQGASVLVEGEPGIGKSSLLRVGLAEAQRVYQAAADELGQRFPLRPLLEALHIGTTDVEQVLAHVDQLCAEPTVLVLDDLHWADDETLHAWQRLSHAVCQLPLLLVAASRPAATRLQGQQGQVVIKLGPLPELQVSELVENLVNATPSLDLRRLTARATGNPLHVREIVDSLRRDGLIVASTQVVADVSDTAAPTLTGAIADRLEFLGHDTTRMVRVASLFGGDFSTTDLAVVLGVRPTDLIDAVDEACKAGVLVDRGARLGFGHPLIRQGMYDELPTGMRAALHRQAAEALADAGHPVERVAAQVLRADEVDEWTTSWLATAGPVLSERAPAVAAELFERVLAEVPVDDPRAALLATLLAEVSFVESRFERAIEVAQRALVVPVDPELKVRLSYRLAYAASVVGQYELAETTVRHALADPGLPLAGVARLRALAVGLTVVTGRRAEAIEAAEQAVCEAERAGDGLVLAHALRTAAFAMGASDSETALALAERAVPLVEHDPSAEAGDLWLKLQITKWACLNNADRMEEANATYRECVARVERGEVRPNPAYHVAAGAYGFCSGGWDDTRAGLESLLATDPTFEHNLAAAMDVRGYLAMIAAHRDDRVSAQRHIDAAPEVTAGLLRNHATYLMLARSMLAERAGRPDEAAAVLAPALLPEYADDMEERWLLLPDLARLALAVEDRKLARAVVGAAAADAVRDPTPTKLTVAQRCRGLVHGDADLLARAVAQCRDVPVPLRIANVLEDHAVVLAPHSPEPARESYLEAVGIYTKLDATWDIMRADNRMRAHGIRRGARGPRKRPVSGWESLTGTELKVAALVARGLSNPDIAVEMYVSRRTVQTHVSNILSKLAAQSRRDIAKAAAAHAG